MIIVKKLGSRVGVHTSLYSIQETVGFNELLPVAALLKHK